MSKHTTTKTDEKRGVLDTDRAQKLGVVDDAEEDADDDDEA